MEFRAWLRPHFPSCGVRYDVPDSRTTQCNVDLSSDFAKRNSRTCEAGRGESPRRPTSSWVQIGVTGFEPPTCRRGDRSQKLVQFLSAASRFVVSLAPRCLRTTPETFRAGQHPGHAVLRCLRFASIMAFEAMIQIFARTDITPSGFFTAQNITVKHWRASGRVAAATDLVSGSNRGDRI